MDKDSPCGGMDRDALVAWLYDDCEPAERERVEAHLAVCGGCAAEAESLRSLRGSLDAWDAPAMATGIRVVSERDARRRPWLQLALRPAWGLAAAAGVLLGVGLAVAGVELRMVDGGFIVQIGSVAESDVAQAERDALLEQVRGLISQSEQRQQQERALWLTEFAQEVDMQRRADQQQFQQELGALEGFADYLVRVSDR